MDFFAVFGLATEDEVEDRASQWDQPVTEYVQLAERYLGFQQPGSVYKMLDAGNGHKRVCVIFDLLIYAFYDFLMFRLNSQYHICLWSCLCIILYIQLLALGILGQIARFHLLY